MGGKMVEREIEPDIRYKSVMLTRFINKVMMDGKKSVAERIVYGALDEVQKKLNKNSLEVFQEAIDNVKPIVEIKSKRIGGATYQIPRKVEDTRSETLAFRWILSAARGRSGQKISSSIASEIIDAYNKDGKAMQQREAVHRMAEANKAFAKFG